MTSNNQTFQNSRRRLVTGGAAVAATTWVAPSIIGFDRVAAAEGSCGIPPVQVDWSDFAGTFPSSVTAADGTVVTITLSDPFGVADAGFFGQVFTGTLSTLDNPLLMAMTGANNGAFTSITFGFSKPVDLCFEMLDVDRGVNSWEDTINLNGTVGGAPVTLGPGDLTSGPAAMLIGPNSIIGTASSANSSTNGNTEITYPAAIDSLEIRHQDDTPWTGFQFIGIHDLRWC